MADLRVFGEYHGPGERSTAETLAQQLPDDWVLIANCSLPTQEHDDIDLVVMGRNLVFVVEDKYWGPTLKVTPGAWVVKRQPRQNPTDRIAFLARKLAGLLRSRVAGYPKHGHIVKSFVVLSNPNVAVDWSEAGPESDMVVLLADAAHALRADDAAAANSVGDARGAAIAFLDGWEGRSDAPTLIGSYKILQELAPLGRAKVFAARDDVDSLVMLRCYPMDGWGPDVDPKNLIRRERKAIQKLANSGRALQSQPIFTDDLRRWIVVPIVQEPMRSLTRLLTVPDPPVDPRTSDLADIVSFLIDAFRALQEVHADGVVHRGIAPSRVVLAEGRVKFTDFFLAHVAGEATVAQSLNDVSDLSVPYRAPECREFIGAATASSDLYSIGLCLLWWLHADAKAAPDSNALPAQTALAEVSAIVRKCVAEKPGNRPAIETIVSALLEKLVSPVTYTFAPGETISDRYRVERALGQGGFAKSWLVFDQLHEDQRVLKQYSENVPDDAVKKEFQAASAIKHDRCARVWDFSISPAYLVADYVDGESLLNASKSEIPPESYRRYALDILDALNYMHGKDFLHNDISPGNVIVEPDGRARLIDFGQARLLDTDTQLGWTRLFAAPEIYAGSRSTASDLYGLGATFLRCMLGRFPYQEDAYGDYDQLTIRGITDEEKTKLGPLGTAIADQFFRLIVPDPDDRPASAAQFTEDLRRAAPVPSETGGANINPTVELLRQLYRGSTLGNAGNRGLDSEFAETTYVETLLDTELTPRIVAGELDLVVLTGNPGDGKTSYLKMLQSYLLESGANQVTEGLGGWTCKTLTRTYSALYDASEARDGNTSDELVIKALTPPGDLPHTALLAINDGRLRQFFISDYSDVYAHYAKAVRCGLRGENPDKSMRVAYVDLKRRSLAPTASDVNGIAGHTLDKFTNDSRWTICQTCSAREVCPIVRNKTQLRGPGREQLLKLVTISHLRRQRRATFRDFRSAAGWVITGDRSCEDVHSAVADSIDLRRGDDALHFDLAFDGRSADYLVREWADLDPSLLPVAALEREERALGERETWHRRDSLNRRAYFADLQSGAHHLRETIPYRYLDDFQFALSSDSAADGLLPRILLGLSRILGAFGYDGSGLALQDGESSGWAVLREIAGSDFHLERRPSPSPFVEQQADELVLIHARARLTISLDSLELILRAADGELINDYASDAIKLEFSLLAAKLTLHPADTAVVVSPAGSPQPVCERDGAIAMGSPL